LAERLEAKLEEGIIRMKTDASKKVREKKGLQGKYCTNIV